MTPAERHARAKAAAARDFRDALAAFSPGDPAAGRRVAAYVTLLEQQAALAWQEVRRLELRQQYPPQPGIYDGRIVEDRTGPASVIDPEGAPSGEEANDKTADGTARKPEPHRLERQSARIGAGGHLLGADPRPAADPDERRGAAMVTQHPELAGRLVLAVDDGDDGAALAIMRQWMEEPGGLVGMTWQFAATVADLMRANAGENWRDFLNYALLDLGTRDLEPYADGSPE